MTHPFRKLAATALAVAVLTVGLCAPAMAQRPRRQKADSPRDRISFNADWLFTKDDPKDADGKLAYDKIKEAVKQTGQQFVKNPVKQPAVADQKQKAPAVQNPGEDVSYVKPEFKDDAWRKLSLPHDWGIEGPFKQEYSGDTGKLPWWGVGWYRKHFDIPEADKGKRFFLDVDGAMSYSTVWLNGHFVGGWPYGYTSYRLDLTPYMNVGGKNVLAVRVDNPIDSSRWYPGGGIYRNVWLVKTAPIHVAQWGTHITTPEVSEDHATINVAVTVENQSNEDAKLEVETTIREMGELIEGPQRTPQKTSVTLPAGKSETCRVTFNEANPTLWSPDAPDLYRADVVVKRNDKIVDHYETTFGIRAIKFDKDKGFVLNGQVLRIHGVCEHHDFGALGAAVNIRAMMRKIELLKEMGCNAIRTSHNPPAPELLELCDWMGMLVMDESFDCWRKGKTTNDYANLFDDWHEKDLRAEVLRDRNHPCVIIWSIGNEVMEQNPKVGYPIGKELSDIIHQEDPTRPTTAGYNWPTSGYNDMLKTIDLFGYNYKPGEYGDFHKANPNVPLFGSETASCVSSRGEYFFPVYENKAKGQENFQVSSYDLYAPRWATTPDMEFEGQDRNPHVAGEFVWTGFDYIGEPTPYDDGSPAMWYFAEPEEKAQIQREWTEYVKTKVPSRSSYFGIFDLCGFKKDRFYAYQARWRPEVPMVHILPHWNWPERVGQVTPVHVYTSGDEVELFLNGKSLGKQKRERYQYRFRWDDVKYEPGELKAVAYKNGKPWAETVMKTTGPAAKLELEADRSELGADGADISFITVTVADKDGLLVPRSKNEIKFSIEGPGEIIAVDNGDPTDHTSFQSKDRKAFNGLCLVIVRTKRDEPGTVALKAQSAGLEGATIKLTTLERHWRPE